MDSLTQAALGAAVAHACWHRQLGRRALAWGLLFGTLPDLDILAYPWLDPIQRLVWHRGESHALWAMLLGAALFAPLLVRIHKNPTLLSPPHPPREPLTGRAAFVGLWLIFASHALIDVFTVYGTQLLAPFSRHGFALNNLFIIDPLYTAPLVFGCLLAAALRTARARQLATVGGLALSTAYVAWSFVAQARAASVFAAELARQGHIVEPGRAITSATPLNTVLWRHLAEVEGGFLLGYWSWLDADTRVRFEFIPRAADTLAPAVRASRAFATVEWFSQGFWAVIEQTNGERRVADLRFGEMRPGPGQPPARWVWPFAWTFPAAPADATGADNTLPLVQAPADFAARGAGFGDVWRRIQGDRTAW
ncbi:MAG: metal-dependent hydrolase [Opitutaceae bacterium]|jgi:inner membrane protein|nr:metal-dependent hydrolase [Opitutaceae bacterium]